MAVLCVNFSMLIAVTSMAFLLIHFLRSLISLLGTLKLDYSHWCLYSFNKFSDWLFMLGQIKHINASFVNLGSLLCLSLFTLSGFLTISFLIARVHNFNWFPYFSTARNSVFFYAYISHFSTPIF